MISRRSFLIGGGAGVGLLLAWELWPRSYRPALNLAPGETMMNGFLKIGEDGHVTIVVPQAEIGQGVYTSLPQILADELGADWRTISVEPAPINPIYANTFLLTEQADALPHFLQGVGRWAYREAAFRVNAMITGGSSSIRGFEGRYREAGSIARALLCEAGGKHMDAEWDACDTADGFVVHGAEKMRFAELAAEAAALKPPAPITLRKVGTGGISGKSVARIDLPSKVDGSARFAADVRLPDMVFASIRNGAGKLAGMNRAAAMQQPGVIGVYQGGDWAAVVASNWWAADRGADRLAPRFEHAAVDSRSVVHALDEALANGKSKRFVEAGDADGLLRAADAVKADYAVGLAAHAPIETLTATARFTGDRLEIWIPTQAPAFARSAVARAVDIDEDRITLYPMLIGGSFGRNVASEAAEVAAILARETKRPVQLIWSRPEDIMHDRFRPPAKARMAAKLGSNGSVLGWRATIAAPSTSAEVLARLMPRLPSGASKPERGAIEGALPPYSIPAVAIDHHVAEIGLPTGAWRSVAHSYTAFFTECFIDELAHKVGVEPLSFRMQMLGNAPRLARCLATVTALGNWQGGEAGSAQGIAAHSCFGSHVAILAEAHGADGRIKVDRIVAAVDCGRMINPDIVRQQIEGGIIFGLSAALGHPIPVTGGHGGARSFDDLGLPRLADTPEIQVEILPSEDEPGGVGEIAVPPVAPAIANALFAASGQRLRSLPLALGSA